MQLQAQLEYNDSIEFERKNLQNNVIVLVYDNVVDLTKEVKMIFDINFILSLCFFLAYFV